MCQPSAEVFDLEEGPPAGAEPDTALLPAANSGGSGRHLLPGTLRCGLEPCPQIRTGGAPENKVTIAVNYPLATGMRWC